MYYPVLRWKAGEARALEEMPDSYARRMVPIIEPTPKWFSKGLQAGIDRFAVRLGRAWFGRECFVDPRLIAGPDGLALLMLQARCDALGLAAIPVLTTDYSAKFVRTLRSAIARPTLGVGLRVSPSELRSKDWARRLLNVTDSWGVRPKDVHLMVDRSAICASDALDLEWEPFPGVPRWGGVVVLAGSFPPDLQHLRPDTHLIPRYEWRAYVSLVESWDGDGPPPEYGDYGIMHPVFKEPIEGAAPSASVRYTLSEDWLVIRGESLRKENGPGFQQYVGHAIFLSKHEVFAGERFSPGDRYIAERVQAGATPGSPSTWISAGTSHHLVRVMTDLAALEGRVARRASK
jgi:hypothetical protein